MKSTTFYTFLFGFAIFLFLTGCGRDSQYAAEYNDSIVSKQLEIIGAFDLLDSVFNDSAPSSERIDYAYSNLRTHVKEGLLQLDSIGSFQKDPSLQLAARELFGSYDRLVLNEYSKLVLIKTLPKDSITQAIADSNMAVTSRIREISKRAQARFLKSQEDFGTKYNLSFQ